MARALWPQPHPVEIRWLIIVCKMQIKLCICNITTESDSKCWIVLMRSHCEMQSGAANPVTEIAIDRQS